MANKIRVLVADDHEAIRKGIRAFLEETRRFHLVAEASHGEECVTLAERLRPDVVIMDITMPGIDGIKATKRLVSLIKGIRVIAHTCHDDPGHILGMLKAGAGGYVCKDEGWAALVRAIDMSADGKVYVSPSIQSVNEETDSFVSEARSQQQPCSLTPRQLDVLRLLARGKKNREIAADLGISVNTVERHREDLKQRTGLKSVVELVRLASDLGCDACS